MQDSAQPSAPCCRRSARRPRPAARDRGPASIFRAGGCARLGTDGQGPGRPWRSMGCGVAGAGGYHRGGPIHPGTAGRHGAAAPDRIGAGGGDTPRAGCSVVSALGLKLAEDAVALQRCLPSPVLLIGHIDRRRCVGALGLLKLVGGPDQHGTAGLTDSFVAGHGVLPQRALRSSPRPCTAPEWRPSRADVGAASVTTS